MDKKAGARASCPPVRTKQERKIPIFNSSFGKIKQFTLLLALLELLEGAGAQDARAPTIK